jgi:ATP phosphoribosyltransferase
VQDGVVDCGITGADLVRERGVDVRELVKLAFGSCTLQAAVPQESEAQEIEDLERLRVATVFPRLSRELLGERNVGVELIDVTGSVEVAPRLGLADAIVDLVSSGNTLRTNGLRSLGVLFSSEAVLVGRPGASDAVEQLARVFTSVVEARTARYLMMNAPAEALPAIAALVPGNRSPTVIPLMQDGMNAVHVLVPANEVWQLLPKLEEAGASSILLVPVERMLG